MPPDERELTCMTIERLFKKLQSIWSRAACPIIPVPIKSPAARPSESIHAIPLIGNQSEQSKVNCASATNSATPPPPSSTPTLPRKPPMPLSQHHRQAKQPDWSVKPWAHPSSKGNNNCGHYGHCGRSGHRGMEVIQGLLQALLQLLRDGGYRHYGPPIL